MTGFGMTGFGMTGFALTGANKEDYRIPMTTNLLTKGWYFTSLK